MLGPLKESPRTRGTSATTGVILMVGVVVIISVGGMTGVFAFVLAPPSVAPQVAFAFEFTDDANSDSLVIKHDIGDTAAGDLVSIKIREAEPASVDGTYQWGGDTLSGNSVITQGSSVTLNVSTVGDDGKLDLNGATVVVTWESAEGDFGVTLEEWRAPTSSTEDPSPSDPGHAYLDLNANGVWDPAVDTKIDDAEVTDGVYDAGSEALVIPDSVGAISANKIDFDGADITIGVDLTATGNEDVVVEASEMLRIEGVTVDTKTGREVVLRGVAGVRADGTMIDAGGEVTVKSNDGTVLMSGGTIDSTEKSGATVEVRSSGNMDLESTAIRTTDTGISEVALGADSATLHIDDVVISDDDDTLRYTPLGVTVEGSPSDGAVAPA